VLRLTIHGYGPSYTTATTPTTNTSRASSSSGYRTARSSVEVRLRKGTLKGTGKGLREDVVYGGKVEDEGECSTRSTKTVPDKHGQDGRRKVMAGLKKPGKRLEGDEIWTGLVEDAMHNRGSTPSEEYVWVSDAFPFSNLYGIVKLISNPSITAASRPYSTRHSLPPPLRYTSKPYSPSHLPTPHPS
jgi:hypothetical protein